MSTSTWDTRATTEPSTRSKRGAAGPHALQGLREVFTSRVYTAQDLGRRANTQGLRSYHRSGAALASYRSPIAAARDGGTRRGGRPDRAVGPGTRGEPSGGGRGATRLYHRGLPDPVPRRHGYLSSRTLAHRRGPRASRPAGSLSDCLYRGSGRRPRLRGTLFGGPHDRRGPRRDRPGHPDTTLRRHPPETQGGPDSHRRVRLQRPGWHGLRAGAGRSGVLGRGGVLGARPRVRVEPASGYPHRGSGWLRALVPRLLPQGRGVARVAGGGDPGGRGPGILFGRDPGRLRLPGRLRDGFDRGKHGVPPPRPARRTRRPPRGLCQPGRRDLRPPGLCYPWYKHALRGGWRVSGRRPRGDGRLHLRRPSPDGASLPLARQTRALDAPRDRFPELVPRDRRDPRRPRRPLARPERPWRRHSRLDGRPRRLRYPALAGHDRRSSGS